MHEPYYDLHCESMEKQRRLTAENECCQDCLHCNVPPDRLSAYGWCTRQKEWVYRDDIIAAIDCEEWEL